MRLKSSSKKHGIPRFAGLDRKQLASGEREDDSFSEEEATVVAAKKNPDRTFFGRNAALLAKCEKALLGKEEGEK